MCKSEGNIVDAIQVFNDLFSAAKFEQPGKKDKKDYEELKKLFLSEMKNILFSIKNEWKFCVDSKEFEEIFPELESPSLNSFYKELFNKLKPEIQIKFVFLN